MSYDFLVVEHDAERPIEEIVGQIIGNHAGEVDLEGREVALILEEFLAELHLSCPPPSSFTDAKVDDSPWASDGDAAPGHLALSLRRSMVGSMAPLVLQRAGHRGLGVYDPQADIYYSPNGEGGEEGSGIESPHLLAGAVASRQLIRQLVPRLSGRRDPFVVVTRGVDEYAQALWTEAGFRFEYRAGSAEQHFAAKSMLEPDVVADLLCRYIAGELDWKRPVEFSHLRF